MINSRLDQDVGSVSALVLRTSAVELKAMLDKTGRGVRDVSGLEKNDFLNLIVDQIKHQIECRGRMNLKLSDINALLVGEGLPSEASAQDAIMQLLQMRGRQLARFGPAHSPMPFRSDADSAFVQALMIIPQHEINGCFALDEPDQAISPPLALGQPYSPRGSPLKTSGHDLMQLLEKVGRSLSGLGILEKLEMLDLIIEQVQENIVLRQRMLLTVSDLQSVLVSEGLDPGDGSARSAVLQLVELRHIQLLRLDGYVRPKSSMDAGAIINAGADFSFTLMQMAVEDVQGSFAPERPLSVDKRSAADRPLMRSDVQPSLQASMETTSCSEDRGGDLRSFGTGNSEPTVSASPGKTPPGSPTFSYSDLEAKVVELSSRLGQAETRAVLAEERAKVARLEAALEMAETRALYAEQRADALESRMALLEGRQSGRFTPIKGESPRRSSSTEPRMGKPRIKPDVPLQRQSTPMGSVEAPVSRNRFSPNRPGDASVEVPGGRNMSPNRRSGVRKFTVEPKSPVEFSPKVRTKAPLPEAAIGICSPIVRRGTGSIGGRPLFVAF